MNVIRLLACVWVAASSAAAAEIDSREIFRKLEPSVVCISSAEGAGSGVVLGADGLIITNYHVVNTAMPLSVEAIADGRPQAIKGVKWIKIHQTQDLALVQLDLGGKKLKAARIAKNERETITGDVCFAIGFPFVPGSDKPELTITKGVISSARRVVNELPYIQIDAPINPGNSGGALANSEGAVIGIPTLKFLGMDRVGMATPLAGLRMDQFVDISRKKGDPAAAGEMAQLANHFFTFDLPAAIYLQRQAIALDPSNPEWSTSLATMYLRLREYDISLAYAKDAVRKGPDHFPAREQLSKVYELRNEPKEAEAARLAAINLPARDADSHARRELAEQLARAYLAARDCAQAAYLASWGLTFSDGPRLGDLRRILREASKSLPKNLGDELAAKKSGHSIDDMNAFLKRARESGIAPGLPANPAQSSIPDSGPEVVVSKVPFPDSIIGKLADAPPGVTYHEDRQELEWTPAPFSKTEKVRVLFMLTRPDGTEEPYIHTIHRK
jgi:tetratricopeptide (TPR) repeat protein